MSTSTSSVVLAPAKLTWSLRVGPRKDDGFHELDAEMITLDLADVLHISEPGEGLYVDAAPFLRADAMSPGKDNLITQALTLCRRHARVEVTKAIPLGGGLGGGSADAAAILRWVGNTDLQAASNLGSDVPFCVVGGRARVTGIGNVIEPLDFEEREVLLLIPPTHVDTGAVYRALDQLRAEGKGHNERNDLLAGALEVAPGLRQWLAVFQDATGLEPVLAGSGSTLFVEGSKELCDLRGVDFLEHDGQRAVLIESKSVPSSFGEPKTL